MTVQEIVAALTKDRIALLFLFMMLPLVAMLLQKAAPNKGNKAPYNYIYSIIVFAACIPGVISIIIWLDTILFDQKGLWQLDVFVFYLPVLVMLSCMFIIKKATTFSELPWFGELYELLVLIAVSFGCIVVAIEKNLLTFSTGWHVILFFFLLFGMFKSGWEWFSRIR